MFGLKINKKFFKSWTPKMSYVLGFIVADGCIVIKRIKKRTGTPQYLLDITSRDKEHLGNIKKVMSAQQKIGPKQRSRGERGGYHIQIGYQEICEDLISLGIPPRKTYKFNPVHVPKEYFSDFVRGFFDGDGSVYIYEVNKTPQIKASFVSSSLSFIDQFNLQLCENLGIAPKAIHISKGETVPQYNICFYIDDCEKLAKFMYRNSSTLCLSRKHRVFKNWKSIKRRHYIKQDYPSKIGWQLNQKNFCLKI